MSRFLNGEGMGFIASAAKQVGNLEIWAGRRGEVAQHRAAEQAIRDWRYSERQRVHMDREPYLPKAWFAV